MAVAAGQRDGAADADIFGVLLEGVGGHAAGGWAGVCAGELVAEYMETAEILRHFERFTGKFPRAAVEAAAGSDIAQREEITLALLRILEETVDRAEKFAADDEYMAHLYAMFLLAQWRETRAYPLMVRFAQLRGDLLEDICGDFV